MFFLFLWIGFAALTAIVANGKGRSGILWLILGVFFGIFALVAVALIPGKNDVRPVAPNTQLQRTSPTLADEISEFWERNLTNKIIVAAGVACGYAIWKFMTTS